MHDDIVPSTYAPRIAIIFGDHKLKSNEIENVDHETARSDNTQYEKKKKTRNKHYDNYDGGGGGFQ